MDAERASTSEEKNNMKNTLAALLLLTAIPSQAVEVSGNIGYTSDYKWRGMSQGNQPATSFGVDVTTDNGYYIGAWSSDVSFDDATRETDYYGGYSFNITEKVAADVGYIRYTYDGTVDSFEEMYLTVNNSWLSLEYYRDLDTENEYGQIGLALKFIPVVDVTFINGYTFYDSSFRMLNISYPVTTDLSIHSLIGQDVFEGDSLTQASIGFTYLF